MISVSCLMITKDRLDCFRQSLRDYCQQDYSEKELVVVSDGDPDYIGQLELLIAATGRSDIRMIRLEHKLPLGALRNISVDNASGVLLCQWDDDDRYHPRRLSEQIQQLESTNADACFLVEQLQLFCDSGEMYWCDWSRRSPWRRTPFYSLNQESRRHQRSVPEKFAIPGTLLTYKRAMPRYDETRTNLEDVIVKNQIYEKGGKVVGLWGQGELSIYVFHGKNTYARNHHLKLARWRGLPMSRLVPLIPRFDAALATYQLSQGARLCAGSGTLVKVFPAPDGGDRACTTA